MNDIQRQNKKLEKYLLKYARYGRKCQANARQMTDTY